MKDLAIPYLLHSQISMKRMNSYSLYFLYWNSDLICKVKYPGNRKSFARVSAAIDYFQNAEMWKEVLLDLECRATNAAKYLSPFFLNLLMSSSRNLPEVISHSLGSFLHSKMIQSLAIDGALPKNLGSWLSLQPAIAGDAFSAQGIFNKVPKAYSHHLAKKEIWYSRQDLVLRLFYQRAKDALPIGLTGMHPPSHWTIRDLTEQIKESHGTVSLNPFQGNLFARVSSTIGTRYLKSA